MKLIEIEYTGPALFREIEGVGKVHKKERIMVSEIQASHLIKSGQFREVKPVQKKKPEPPPRVDLVKPKKAEEKESAGGEE